MDQVTIEPNGKWSQTFGRDTAPRDSTRHPSSDDEEELVEIRDMPRLASVKNEAQREPGMMRTPPISSREQSTSSAPSSNKRPAGQVVDLTLSSDEDDEPPRGPKRQVTHKSSSGLPKVPRLENVPLRTNGVNGGVPRQHPSNPFPTPHYTPREFG